MKRITSFLVCLAIFGFSAFGQDLQISGKVTSADDGTILPGVSVVVKGTTIGTTTNIDGNYTINAPSDATLVYSFVGMITKELAVNGSTAIDVSMKTDVTGLEEIIVVGYGTSTREANTGSVSVVKSEDIADVPEQSFEKMLTGRVAGVQITAESGQPGANSTVRIRGASSITAGNEPLYVVDGIAVMSGDQSYFSNTSNALGMINPSDIESVSVLKDASAAAIYGSRASNGVIIITTKSGKQGKTKINFKASYGMTSLANDNGFDVLTPEQLIALKQDGIRNIGLDPNDPANGKYYVPDSMLQMPMNNWMKAVTRYGNINDYELSISGGTEKTSHFTSAKYSKTEGIVYGNDYEKMQLRTNIDHKISDKLKYGVKLNAFHSMSNDIAMQSLYYVNPLFGGLAINPYTPIYNEDGTHNLTIPEWSNTNPVASAVYDDQWEKQNRLYGSIYLEWEPIKNLKLKTNNGAEYTDGEGRRFWSAEADANGNTTLQTSRTQYSQVTSSNTASYFLLVGDHNLNLIGGAEFIDNRDNSYYVSAPNVDPKIPFLTTAPPADDDADYAESRYTMASFFGIVDYSYASKYYFRASYRMDGSSKFGINNRWGSFYSVAVSWNMQNEDFMQGITILDLMKFRASYGVSGNDNIGRYAQWGTYGSSTYNGVVGAAPTRPANPDLTWEGNQEYNIGLDFGFLSKISGSVDFYSRKSTDMLLDVPLSRTTGFNVLTQNAGSLKNTGVEFLINYNILNSDVVWNAGFNIAHNKSEILDLVVEEGEFYHPNSNRILLREGEQLLSYHLYDYAGVNPVNGEALWYNEDGDITNNFADARREILGSPEPKFIGGFNTDVSYKGINLAINLEFKTGNQVLIEELHYLQSDGYWFTRNQVNTQLDYWKQPGDITRNPKPLADNTTNSNAYTNPRWMFDGSYLRIKNITLAYNFPETLTSKMKIENLRLYTSAVNLYTFHDVDFYDPERGELGIGFGIYPMIKSLVFGLDVTF